MEESQFIIFMNLKRVSIICFGMRGKKMASIREVAKLAGVSPSTVSRVMNNTANVDEEKKKRVLEAIEKTGFKPNELARALFKQSLKIIGVIVPSIENPFFNEMARAIEEEAFEKGYRILLCNSNGNVEKERMNIQMLNQMKADGLIMMAQSEKTSQVISECEMPVVVLDRMINGEKVIANISSDNYQGGLIAAEHLRECGCENIVCMRGPLNASSGKERYRGYQDFCKKYELDEQCVDSEYSYDEGLRAAEEIFEKYPSADGIIASNDMVAISTYKVLQKKGYRVPEDIQIVGYDNIKFSKLFTPEITTVRQQIEEMGRLAVQIIISYITGKEFKKDNTFSVELIRRESTKKKEN